MRVFVRVHCGFTNGNWISELWIHWEGYMDVPECATINDMKSLIHGKLWELNASRPTDDRVSDMRMQGLDFMWRGALEPTPAPGQSTYVMGAQLLRQAIDARDEEGGMPTFNVWV